MIAKSKTTNFRQSLGKIGEAMAQEFLVSSAWTIEACNFCVHRIGEIDIIARPPAGKVLAFVEVKTRRLSTFGLESRQGLDHPGQQSVHRHKQRRMRQAALTYVSSNIHVRTSPSLQRPDLRFDLILVDVQLNYRDLQELVAIRDINALRPHCVLTHLTEIMGTF
jgi:Holliday junction resolvase-like predicted endonuclease